ncbi:Fimbrin SEF17 minor subunit [Hartmannibacter diazotrophicus]|uniref:Fimbrin SEF17 minor subunit n=1 Tax=Hartmannibacter diazotrophicus TaxID=1482074 RepID=A0A2C9DD91_9HYPH|nr:hypothetical protein [Hartmannibacter diazotrophicus]SON58140.1 Fimbrin SEF17 minor subunit [Hartmannibacter diazotrophicus]
MKQTVALAAALLVSATCAATAGPGSTLAYIDQIDPSAAGEVASSTLIASSDALLSGVAELSASLSTLSPDGDGNLSLIDQHGSWNAATLMQDGARNAGLISQTGFFNAATISQTGSGHQAFVVQQGQGNVAVISQR